MTNALPFSQACENNQQPILEIIQPLLKGHQRLLEIGSGTAQHAVYFAQAMPHLSWQTSDLSAHHAGINARLAAMGSANIKAPIELDVTSADWSGMQCDAVFSANTLHIMSWASVQAFFAGVGVCLPEAGLLVVYGPFNYQGNYTSESNARFDQWLAQQNPHSAIRDFEAVNQAAELAGLSMLADHAMPANNRLLVWRKTGISST